MKDDETAPKKEKGPSEATLLAQEFINTGVLTRDEHGCAWWSWDLPGEFEAVAVDGSAFRDQMSLYLYGKGRVVSSSTLKDAAQIVGAMARQKVSRPVYNRMGGTYEKLYLALYDATKTVIEIDAEGWRVAEAAGVLFHRPGDALALPMPVRGGSFDDLRPFVNVSSEDDWKLIVAWLLSATMPQGPYPVLVLSGEAGSAKTSTARALRRVFDPSAVEDRGVPKDMDAMAATARAARIMALDNLSWANDELADMICRLATGAGIGKRQLYSDADEFTLRLARPVMLNGIPELVSRGDLASRCISIEAPKLDVYRDEREMREAWEAAHPKILGALLNTVSRALRNIDSVELGDKAPRMADFARWTAAAAPALGWGIDDILRAFEDNQNSGARVVLESNPLTSSLYAVALDGFDGTSTELLAAINDKVESYDRPARGWPRTANTLSGQVRRLAGPLRSIGACVESVGKHNNAKHWVLSVPEASDRPARVSSRPPAI